MDAVTKKKLLIWIAIAAGALLFIALLCFMAFVGQFNTYRDNPNGFTIKFPRRWQVVSNPEPGGAVAFISQKENAMDRFRENVNIAIQDVPPDVATLKSFSDQILLQMSKVFGNVKAVRKKNVTFGGRPGYMVQFSVDKPDKIQILNVWTIKGDKAYILTYMALTDKYKKYLPLAGHMIKTFKFKS